MQWHDKFDNLIIFKGFKVNETDKCIYYKFENSLYAIIYLYVYNMLISWSNLHVITNVKSMLSANFDIKDLEEANVIVGIKIARFEKGFSFD